VWNGCNVVLVFPRNHLDLGCAVRRERVRLYQATVVRATCTTSPSTDGAVHAKQILSRPIGSRCTLHPPRATSFFPPPRVPRSAFRETYGNPLLNGLVHPLQVNARSHIYTHTHIHLCTKVMAVVKDRSVLVFSIQAPSPAWGIGLMINPNCRMIHRIVGKPPMTPCTKIAQTRSAMVL
jgi:hypothetical protein